MNNNKADKQTKVYENFSVLMTKTELATTYAELFAEEEEAEPAEELETEPESEVVSEAYPTQEDVAEEAVEPVEEETVQG